MFVDLGPTKHTGQRYAVIFPGIMFTHWQLGAGKLKFTYRQAAFALWSALGILIAIATPLANAAAPTQTFTLPDLMTLPGSSLMISGTSVYTIVDTAEFDAISRLDLATGVKTEVYRAAPDELIQDARLIGGRIGFIVGSKIDTYRSKTKAMTISVDTGETREFNTATYFSRTYSATRPSDHDVSVDCGSQIRAVVPVSSGSTLVVESASVVNPAHKPDCPFGYSTKSSLMRWDGVQSSKHLRLSHQDAAQFSIDESAFSEDGKTLAFVTRSGARIVDVGSAATTRFSPTLPRGSHISELVPMPSGFAFSTYRSIPQRRFTRLEIWYANGTTRLAKPKLLAAGGGAHVHQVALAGACNSRIIAWIGRRTIKAFEKDGTVVAAEPIGGFGYNAITCDQKTLAIETNGHGELPPLMKLVDLG